MAWSPRKTEFRLGRRALRIGGRTLRVGRPPLIEQLTKGHRPPLVAQRLGDIRADRLCLAIIDGLAGVPGKLLGGS
jgi:hypothetical protein